MSTAYCEKCGATFQRGMDEAWKTLCIPCFKRKKQGEATDYAPDRSGGWRALYFEKSGECSRLREQIAAIQSVAPAIPPLDELREQLPRLLLCCHPDKHGNSLASTQATQYLLQLRARLNA